MYLNEIYLENTGPISKCHVKLPFDGDKPLPVVIVGPNGSGKTIFLSYIVDALTEFAKNVFDDIVPSDGLSAPYFRVVHQRAIRSGEPFSLCLLHFKSINDNLYYCEKSGKLNSATYSPDVKSVFSPVWNWETDGNHKYASPDKKTIETDMKRGVYAFFPSSRCEQPEWLNLNSLGTSINDTVSQRFDNQRFNNELGKPLYLETCAEKNIGWILDVFLDSSINAEMLWQVDITEGGGRTLLIASPSEIKDIKDRYALGHSRRNIDRVLKEILQDSTAKLLVNIRNRQSSRLAFELAKGKTKINLKSLSDGQSQLFHLFTTIIRYGENTNINNSINLSDITGLVVIDEIDANLHPTLQHDVLPRLIEMFPKVQFIVSSHSPLFLLGMEKRFGADRVTILEMPEAERINSERYSEFGKAFEFFQSTESYEADIKQRFANMTKPVVLTEGKTDAKYIQTALQLLGEETLLNSLEIQPVGVKVGQEWQYGGKDGLNRVNTFYKKDPSLLDRMLLLLYDWDANKEDETGEKIWIRFIPENPNDPDNKSGIENLFSEDLFEDRFYDEEPEKGIHGRNKVDPKFKKIEFCQWICDKRRNPDDFEKFKEVVQILKEFVEAAQQPPPE